MKELITFVKEYEKKYPQHKEEINNFLTLCQDEIEEGNSETNEIELCKSSILQLVGEE